MMDALHFTYDVASWVARLYLAWFLVELVHALARGFRRGWVEHAERLALEDSTVVGDRTDQALWDMADETRRRTGR